jgi:DivIVA domain-containing protein
MALTPVEIRHVELRRTWFRGYRRGIVERLLSDIADSFEDVWRERADLADRLEELESEAS